MPVPDPKARKFADYLKAGYVRSGGGKISVKAGEPEIEVRVSEEDPDAASHPRHGKAAPHLMAEGGEVPAILGVQEFPDHFLVTETTGSYEVPKDGLEPDTIAHIQGMAHGGEVFGIRGGVRVGSSGADMLEGGGRTPADVVEASVGDVEIEERVPDDEEDEKKRGAAGGKATPLLMADGGTVPGSEFLPLAYPAPLPQIQGGLPEAPAAVSALPEGHWLRTGGEALARGAMGLLSDPTQALGAIANSPAAPLLSTTGIGPLLGLAKTGQNALGAAENAVNPPLPAAGMPVLTDPGPAQVAPAPPPEQPPAPMPQMPGMGGSGAMAELNRGLAEQQAGLRASVEVDRQLHAAEAELAQEHVAQLQAAQADYAQRAELTQRRADDLFQAVLNNKIDPNRVWANADLGQRIGAGIGILLSGIGVGLAGGPNLALQQINTTIDRDIAAQRDNLETQKGLLSYYLQQGRDMMSAHQLAKADLKDMFAAQMTAASAQFGGAEAAARAQMASGQLRMEAATKRSQIFATESAMKQQQLALQQEQRRQAMLSALLSQHGNPALGDPAVREMLPREVRERLLRLPNGQWVPAANLDQANDLAKGFRAADEMKRGLQRFSALLQSGHPKIWSGVGGDMSAAEELYGMLTARLKEAQKLGAMSESDYDLIKRQIPDITSWRTSDAAALQKLAGLGQAIDDAIASQLKTLGLQ